jgi:predicted PurR-regulated permease PerM
LSVGRKALEQKSYYDAAVKLFIFIAVILIVVAGKTLFIPLMIAIFFTFLLFPISARLERKKIPRAVAIIISIIIAILFFGGLIFFFITQVNSFMDDLPQIKTSLVKKGTAILNWVEQRTRVTQQEQIEWLKSKLSETGSNSPTMILGIFSATGTLIALMALIPLYIFFLTYLREKYIQFIHLVFKEQSDKTIQILKDISTVSRKYLKGILIDVLILSVLGSIGYLLLGIKHAILFAVLAALLNIIPYVGVAIGSILPVMMALITKDDAGIALGALGVALLVQFIDNNFISPIVVGSSVSLNPLTAIIALIIGAIVWGIAGMILAIPLTGMIKVICDQIQSLKPYGFLLGEEVNYRERSYLYRRKKKTA